MWSNNSDSNGWPMVRLLLFPVPRGKKCKHLSTTEISRQLITSKNLLNSASVAIACYRRRRNQEVVDRKARNFLPDGPYRQNKRALRLSPVGRLYAITFLPIRSPLKRDTYWRSYITFCTTSSGRTPCNDLARSESFAFTSHEIMTNSSIFHLDPSHRGEKLRSKGPIIHR